MSDRPLDINLSGSTDTHLTSDLVDPTPEEFERRIATVLDRGWAIDRFSVKLPGDLWGEWVPRDSISIARAQTLGFRIDDTYAISNQLNDAGDGGAVIGDVVFMVQPKWMHDALERHRRMQYIKTHLNPKKQKEEADFLAENARLDLPPINNSQANEVTGPEINDALTPKV